MKTSALTPQTMATLIQLARDIYPHDQVADKYYAIAMKAHEVERPRARPQGPDRRRRGRPRQARRAPAAIGLGWEDDRVAMLRAIEHEPFFQAIRGGLVVGLYDQHAIWPIFGYEGESYRRAATSTAASTTSTGCERGLRATAHQQQHSAGEKTMAAKFDPRTTASSSSSVRAPAAAPSATNWRRRASTW